MSLVLMSATPNAHTSASRLSQRRPQCQHGVTIVLAPVKIIWWSFKKMKEKEYKQTGVTRQESGSLEEKMNIIGTISIYVLQNHKYS